MSYVRADVKCYHCGRVAGSVLGRKGASLEGCIFQPRAGGSDLRATAIKRLRCDRCNGPVFLDEFETLPAIALSQIAKGRREVA